MGINDKSIRLNSLEHINDLMIDLDKKEGLIIDEEKFFKELSHFVEEGLLEPLHLDNYSHIDTFEYGLQQLLKDFNYWITLYQTGKMINFEHHFSEILNIAKKYENEVKHYD